MLAVLMETLITVTAAIAQTHSPPYLCDDGTGLFFFFNFLITIYKKIKAHKEEMIYMNKSLTMLSFCFHH